MRENYRTLIDRVGLSRHRLAHRQDRRAGHGRRRRAWRSRSRSSSPRSSVVVGVGRLVAAVLRAAVGLVSGQGILVAGHHRLTRRRARQDVRVSVPTTARSALVIVLAYLWLPYMIVPIYAGLERLPDSLLDASSDLGAHFGFTFRTVVLAAALPVDRRRVDVHVLVVVGRLHRRRSRRRQDAGDRFGGVTTTSPPTFPLPRRSPSCR